MYQWIRVKTGYSNSGCQTTPKSVETSSQTVEVAPTATPTPAEPTKLRWNPHPNEKGTLAGYRIYLNQGGGIKGKLLLEIKDPKVTEISLEQFKSLIESNKAYYIYLSAFDKANHETADGQNKICLGKGCAKK